MATVGVGPVGLLQIAFPNVSRRAEGRLRSLGDRLWHTRHRRGDILRRLGGSAAGLLHVGHHERPVRRRNAKRHLAKRTDGQGLDLIWCTRRAETVSGRVSAAGWAIGRGRRLITGANVLMAASRIA